MNEYLELKLQLHMGEFNVYKLILFHIKSKSTYSECV